MQNIRGKQSVSICQSGSYLNTRRQVHAREGGRHCAEHNGESRYSSLCEGVEAAHTSRPDARFMPKKEAGTVQSIREKEATATMSSTLMILFLMASSCIAHTSRVLSMFSTISCSNIVARSALLTCNMMACSCIAHTSHVLSTFSTTLCRNFVLF